jgi:hypothetical protein
LPRVVSAITLQNVKVAALIFLQISVMFTAVFADEAPKLTVEVYPLTAEADESLLETVRALIEPNGRAALDKKNNRLIVIAAPEQQKLVADLVKKLNVPQKNIQIEVRFLSAASAQERAIGVQPRDGVIVVPQVEKSFGRVDVFWGDSRTQTARDVTQLVTVGNGGTGYIQVGEEVPYVDWFFQYGVNYGYISSQIQWKNVGARLAVQPRIVGDGSLINVRITPELSYFVDERRFITAFENASTDVTVRNGEEFRIGGHGGNQEFYSKFLVGYGSGRQIRSLDIILKPTMLESP